LIPWRPLINNLTTTKHLSNYYLCSCSTVLHGVIVFPWYPNFHGKTSVNITLTWRRKDGYIERDLSDYREFFTRKTMPYVKTVCASVCYLNSIKFQHYTVHLYRGVVRGRTVRPPWATETKGRKSWRQS
jgi:hypothetical protein